MTKAEYREKRRWERIGLRSNRTFDPIPGVVRADVNCTCFITIAGDHTVLNGCVRHGVEDFCASNSAEVWPSTSEQQDKLLNTLTQQDYD